MKHRDLIDDALRILDAIRSSGRMEYGDYSRLHDAILEIYGEGSGQTFFSVEERMPEEPFGCLLIVDDTEPYTGTDFLNYLPYFAGWDGERWNGGDGEQVPFEVRYWMPLPSIPKEAE